jgi:hypothetical protein
MALSQQELVDTLAGLTLFADLSRPQLEQVSHKMSEESFPEGQRVLRQGFTGTGFYVILDGEVAIRIDGQEVARLAKGDFFGEMSVLLGEPPVADVVALRQLHVLHLGGPELEGFLRAHPSVMLRMLKTVAMRLLASLSTDGPAWARWLPAPAVASEARGRRPMLRSAVAAAPWAALLRSSPHRCYGLRAPVASGAVAVGTTTSAKPVRPPTRGWSDGSTALAASRPPWPRCARRRSRRARSRGPRSACGGRPCRCRAPGGHTSPRPRPSRAAPRRRRRHRQRRCPPA